MAKIKEVYRNDDYYPFTLYCEEHGYLEMSDLLKCEFHKLRSESDISPGLLSKIKTIFIFYSKQHPAEFVTAKKSAQKSAKSSLIDDQLENQLKLYFQNNSDKLIHITDVTKSIGQKVKRVDIIRILGQAAWCKTVDDTTFFYSES
jgi:hypothetical protein